MEEQPSAVASWRVRGGRHEKDTVETLASADSPFVSSLKQIVLLFFGTNGLRR